VLVVASWSSVICAFVLFASEPWDRQFGRPFNGPSIGWLVEAIQSLLTIVLGVTLMRTRFIGEFRDIWAGDGWFHVRPTIRQAARLLWIIAVLVGIWTLIWHHYVAGPLFLSDAQQTTLEIARRNYLIYLPYSFINFIVIDTALLAVSVYGVATTYYYLNAERYKLRNRKNSRIDGFEQYRDSCEKSLRRYLDLFAAMTLVCLYQYFLGHRTLSSNARQFFWEAAGLISLSVIAFVFVGSLYQTEYDVTCDDDERATEEWKDKNSPKTFFKSLGSRSASGWILTSILIIPVSEALKAWLKSS
jgi:hypothetical protein